MRRFFLLILLAVLSQMSHAQYSLNCSGSVQDLSGTPISNHSVKIESLDSNFFYLDSTQSNTLGIYSFSIQNNVPNNFVPFLISTEDCQGITQSQVIFTSTTIAPTFSICGNIIPVQADFTWTVDSSNPAIIHFQDLSQGAITQYTWQQNGSTFSTQANPSYLFPAVSTNTVCLLVQGSPGLNDSICKTVKISSCSSSFTYTTNGATVSFQANSSPQASIYSWDFGDGQSQITTNPVIQHTYNANGSYQVELQSIVQSGMDSCVSSDQQTIMIASTPTGNLSGSVFLDSTYLNSGWVYLFEHDTNNIGLNLIDSTQIQQDSSGFSYFLFSQLAYRNYMLKAVPHGAGMNTYFETWSFSAFNWQDADVISVNGPQNQALIILKKIEVISSGGNATISGTIKTSSGQMISNAKVFLLSTDSLIVDMQRSNQLGYYEFNNLALGSYLVYPEIDGIQTQVVPVSLNMQNPSYHLPEFIVGNAMISTSLQDAHRHSQLDIHPNPFTNRINLIRDYAGHTGHIIIRNTEGKIVYRKTIARGEKTMDLSLFDLPKGIYLLSYISQNELFTKKIIKF
jgi:PKD repeat protein